MKDVQCTKTNELRVFELWSLKIVRILAKHPPSVGFPSSSGGAAPSAPPLGAFDAPLGALQAPILETDAFGGGKSQ